MSIPGGHHWLEREDSDGVTVVRFVLRRLHGEDACREVFGLLYGLVDEAGRSRVVLDMGRVEYVDSSAIGKLVLLNHKAQAAGGRLALCRLSPTVFQVLVTMHLTETFAIYTEEGEAVRSFSLEAGSPS
jgi:anti-sigma B factor antagonist